MPLPPPISPRALKHRRAIEIEAFAREDGLWDIDAHITDVKTRDANLASGLRPAGEPLHDLSLRITVDTRFNIVDAVSSSDRMPYPGYCDAISPAYKKLVGMNLLKSFRLKAQEALGGVLGCTHITDLAVQLPTAAIQAFAGDVFDPNEASQASGKSDKPFQLDRCHALRTDGPAVVQFYPRWAVTPEVTSS
jgi:hypothetical protein